jgi:ribosome-associated heat shock protein Hsp15
MLRQRLDKWLWCARLTKTRTLAARLIADGKIKVNGARVVKLATPLKAGDVLTGFSGGRLFVVRVLAEAERRGPASVARTLYEDLTPKPSVDSCPSPIAAHKGPRPTKRERRRLDALVSRSGDRGE